MVKRRGEERRAGGNIKRRDKTRRWPFFGQGAREEGEINRTGRSKDEQQATHTWGRGAQLYSYTAGGVVQ